MDLAAAQLFSKQIIDRVRGKHNILIVTHDNPDPDALATAYALSHLLLMSTGEQPLIASGGVIGRRENRTMVEKLDIEVAALDDVDCRQFAVICMVDSQPRTGNGSLPEVCKIDIIIDHHPQRVDPHGDNAAHGGMIVDVRPEYGACATILYEYLLAQDIYIGTRLATALFYAIRSETQDLGREWSNPDRTAYQKLLPLSNNRILFEISRAKVPADYFLNFSQALNSARVYHDILVFNMFEVEHPDMVAELTDFLLRVEGVSVVLGMGCYAEQEVLSFRTDRADIFAGQVIRDVVDGLGTAGGHGMIAGGQIRPMLGDHKEQSGLEKILTQRLIKVLGYQPVRGHRLLAGA
ncbi:MAG: DHH family phosphoesterase [Desulfuromonas sp.]|nr:DHH family phosphoesterase [Desulfuromonas sp.]